MCNSNHHSVTMFRAAYATLLGVGLIVCTPVFANTQDAAVATADASVDSVIDHTVNTTGLDTAKAISQNNGITILQKDPVTAAAFSVTQKATPKKNTEIVTASQASQATQATLEAMLK